MFEMRMAMLEGLAREGQAGPPRGGSRANRLLSAATPTAPFSTARLPPLVCHPLLGASQAPSLQKVSVPFRHLSLQERLPAYV